MRILGFHEEFIPLKYLCILFLMGYNKASYLSLVIERIKSRVVAWKARWLSISSRIMLIKLVLSTIPNYYLVVLKPLHSILLQIQKLMRGFLWMGNMTNDKKIALISLEEMAYTPIVGSVRVHDCQDGMRHLEAR